MPKKKTEETFNYPKRDDVRVGCKVVWYYYKNKADAVKASKVAQRHAEWRAARGFDFGYCCPGSIDKIKEGKYKDLYEVCIP